uniref:Uncharacterized protein n=1 Tax=Arundo donax TaxID=35708 RepID=A0A0A9GZ79_ARUDO
MGEERLEGGGGGGVCRNP